MEDFVCKIQQYQEKYKGKNKELDKLSIIFANNRFTTTDIKRINSNEDSLELMLDEKISEINQNEATKQAEYEYETEQSKRLISKNKKLEKSKNDLEMELRFERNKFKKEKYKRDIHDKEREKSESTKRLSYYQKVDEYIKKHSASTGRLIILALLTPIILSLYFYINKLHLYLIDIFSTIGSMKETTQNILIEIIIPSCFLIIYYIIVTFIFGSPLQPMEVFRLAKSKVLLLRLKKYMIKHQIPLEYRMDNVDIQLVNEKLNIDNINYQIKELKITLENLKDTD